MIRPFALAIACLLSVLAGMAAAHEVRPAYLEIRETGASTYDIFWKVPARGDAVLPIEVVLPRGCQDATPRIVTRDTAARATRWSIRCDAGLADEGVRLEGLDRTLVETIVRYEREDGATQTARLFEGATSFVPTARSTLGGVAALYLALGFEHILLGFDHLCFVFVLLLLTDGLRRLFWAVTAFTAAHSITLAAATLGYVNVPSGPIEALIAFSIMLVAAEVVQRARQAEPNGRAPLDRGIRLRAAARSRLRGSACGYRAAPGRHSGSALLLQHRGRTGADRLRSRDPRTGEDRTAGVPGRWAGLQARAGLRGGERRGLLDDRARRRHRPVTRSRRVSLVAIGWAAATAALGARCADSAAHEILSASRRDCPAPRPRC
ncbi:HupE/UreJ family protein [Limibaculum sp. M0105]|uniref:HupE/UreJ family protein n=1 Tax=Thermohalobaculum xanthum TaxID=2753746 RepID=A0A8J7M7D1_9RHOB|nr:HupE/UreJ family protein [Thermohalobaculum xanthum]MBK0399045.1 HupE/UreJ family protein [Thermohalobaculum xanthum]